MHDVCMRADLHTSCTKACALPLARDSSPHTRLLLLCVMTRLVLVAQVHDLGGLSPSIMRTQSRTST
jgi:hypothetical protein